MGLGDHLKNHQKAVLMKIGGIDLGSGFFNLGDHLKKQA
jgi:hypothetical protein